MPPCSKAIEETSDALRRWICRAAAEEEPEGLPRHGEEGWQGVARARRASIPRMRRRRREGRKAHLVSAQREDEEQRNGGVLLHRLQVARRPRPRAGQGDEGQAARQ